LTEPLIAAVVSVLTAVAVTLVSYLLTSGGQ
jgi:hypothetical protein